VSGKLRSGLTSGATVHTYNNRGRMKTGRLASTGTNTNYDYNALGQRMRKAGGTPGTIYFDYDEAGHLVGEYNSTGGLVQETVWLGDIPVATLRPRTGGGFDVFYVHTDQLNTPRKVTRPSDNQLRWRWDPTPFGEGAPNENPSALGGFKYHLRFPGQYFDVETNLNYNYLRDYDSTVGRYIESDPAGLTDGASTYSYVSSNPIWYFDLNGLGKAGGQANIGGNDPLIDRSIGRNSTTQQIQTQIAKIENALKTDTSIGKSRAAKLRAWIKVAKRGFTKSICPPLLDTIALGAAREMCLLGDMEMCAVFELLGGEIERPRDIA
jgi:RHS repeat-associated protein